MMRRILALLALLSLAVSPVAAQVIGSTPSASGPGATEPAPPATPIALPSLPLAAGARIMVLGDSLSQFNSGGLGMLAVGSSSSGAMEWAVAADPRVNFDYWYDPADPWTASGVRSAMNGANQGIAGDHLVDARASFGFGIRNRLAYALSRNPQIVWLNAGTNTINSGDPASAGVGANGGSGNGASAAYVTGKLDAIINQITGRGIYVILSTLFPRGDWPSGDARRQVLRDVNVWIRAQAGRSGVVVSDPYVALVSPTNAEAVNTAMFSADLIHPGPAGARVIGIQYIKPAIAALVAAGSAFDQDIAVSNYYSATLAQMNGTTGVRSGSSVSGTVPTGYTVTGGSIAGETIVASIEAASGYNRIVVTITPFDNVTGNAYHFATISLPQVTSPAGLAAGDWVQPFLHVEASDPVSFAVGRLSVGVNQVSTGRVTAIHHNESSSQFSQTAAGPGGYWIVGKPMQIPAGATFDRIAASGLTIYYPRTLATPFTVKVDRKSVV